MTSIEQISLVFIILVIMISIINIYFLIDNIRKSNKLKKEYKVLEELINNLQKLLKEKK